MKPVMFLDKEVVAFGKIKEHDFNLPQSHTILGGSEVCDAANLLMEQERFAIRPKYKPFPGWNSEDNISVEIESHSKVKKLKL